MNQTKGPMKALMFWSTNQARELVRKVLTPHPELGLRQQDIYRAIHDQFPVARHNLVPRRYTSMTFGNKVAPPPFAEHPIRSMAYLKRVVLPEMESRGEIQEVFLRKGSTKDLDEQGQRLDVVKIKGSLPKKMVTDLGFSPQSWRWRLVPGHVPQYTPDPDPSDMFEQRRQRAKEKFDILRRRKEGRYKSSKV